jgi:hypothetical protein
MSIAFSVDLEPNKDGSFDGVDEAMDWYNTVIPSGTVYVTYRIATERPDIVADLGSNHEIGVHVHPQDFGHETDNLAMLARERQRELIRKTRMTVADAVSTDPDNLTAFRAGRHKASPDTLAVLAALGFEVDASVNVRYREHMPAAVTDRRGPFEHDSGLVELPTTYGEPPLCSRVGVRAGPGGNVTATASELRSDRRLCSGLRALSWLLETTPGVVSMYMHPYDATTYHEDLENSGPPFRDRLKILLDETERPFLTATDVRDAVRQ